MKNKQKKISFQSIAFGCTVFSAILIGAWFLFPIEEMIAERLPTPSAEHRPAPQNKPVNKMGEESATKLDSKEEAKEVVEHPGKSQKEIVDQRAKDDGDPSSESPPLGAAKKQMMEEKNNHKRQPVTGK